MSLLKIERTRPVSSGFVYLRPVYVMFVRTNGAYASSAQRAWQHVFDWLDESRLRQSVTVGYGLLHDNPKEVAVDSCRYDACIEIPESLQSNIPAQFSVQKLPGGAFARMRHSGETSDLSTTIAELRDKWIPDSGLWLDPARPMLETYRQDSLVVGASKLKVDVCIPVTAEQQTSCDRSAA